MDLVRHLLFENPLALWIVLGLVALVALGLWARTRSERALWVAAGCILVSMALAVLAWAVETNYEKVARTLATMASAAENGRADQFIERVSPQYQNGPYGKEELARIVAAALGKVRIAAGDPVIDLEDRQATVQQEYTFQILGSTSPLAQAQIPVTWEGQFAPDPDGEWRLRSATAIKPTRVTPEEAAKYLH